MGNAPGSMRAQPWMALSCEVTRPRRRRTESSLGQLCQARVLCMCAHGVKRAVTF